jgi:DNA polymerase III subunit gamma/tau
MPTPADLVRALSNGEAVNRVAAAVPTSPAATSSTMTAAASGPLQRTAGDVPTSPGAARMSGAGPALAAPLEALPPELAPVVEMAPAVEFDPMPQSFAEIIELFDRRREGLLRSQLWSQVHLVAFEPGRIEFRPAEGAPRDLASRLMLLLGEWTGRRWTAVISQAQGAPTLAEDEAQRNGELRNEVAAHPLVRAVLDTFPGATIAAVRERYAAADAGTDEAVTLDAAADIVGDDEMDTEEDGA